MPRYLARIEMHNAAPVDHVRLQEFMEEAAFETTITGANGRRCALPSAEFFLDIDMDIQAVRMLIEDALRRTGRDHVFIVVEIASAAWSLHER